MKRKKLERDDLMERARATVAFVNGTRAVRGREDRSQVELRGFLALFHPDMSEKRQRKLLRAEQDAE